MQLCSDVLPLPLQYTGDLLTTALLMLNRCVENKFAFGYMFGNNKDATAQVRKNLFREHMEHSLKVTVKILETVAYYHLLQIFFLIQNWASRHLE